LTGQFRVGQRWISEMEPELGLGLVTQVDGRMVLVRFPAGETERRYAAASAPLRRVEFSAGDVIRDRSGAGMTIDAVEEEDGLLFYRCGKARVPESELSDALSFTSPRDRLLGGFSDSGRAFNLRVRARRLYCDYLQSAAAGFIGGRIDLIPHQLSVAHEVASRQQPRVLLSDEVGLGKTIEACLIMHRLLQSGRIERVLVLAPESLVHQWFVELVRRFNLLFRIVDDEFAADFAESEPDGNVFLLDQMAICNIDTLVRDEALAEQAIAAGWDLVIIDEAHHLSEESRAYRLAESLSRISAGLLLLTATPEQLGRESHFARLHLLDPARYSDYQRFLAEAEHYQSIAAIANALLEKQPLSKADLRQLQAWLPDTALPAEGEPLQESGPVIQALLDRHGLGRVLFRNTRAAVAGFPPRRVELIPLPGEAEAIRQADQEWEPLQVVDPAGFAYRNDPRLLWLVDHLRKHRRDKVVLICRRFEQVIAIEGAIRHHSSVQTALFHEKLTLLQRDRNAAWFAQPDGARLLICSEIGSEGRNFQHAHSLVLFDLPEQPELLEQRIGRLDRIGQQETVRIFVPYLCGSAQEVWARWYHEGMDAFNRHVPAAYALYQAFADPVRQTARQRADDAAFLDLLRRTREMHDELARQLEAGRDRLLELHSFQPQAAEELAKQIGHFDGAPSLERLLLELFELYGVQYHDIAPRTYVLNFETLIDPAFPVPQSNSEEFPATFDRRMALQREEVAFFSWDHPLVQGALDVLLGSERGNCSVAVWHGADTAGILLEAFYLIECVAPRRLHAERFLPPTPIRCVVDQRGREANDKLTEEQARRRLRDSLDRHWLENMQLRQTLLPALLAAGERIAAANSRELVDKSLQQIDEVYNREIDRLRALQAKNPYIDAQEIAAWQSEREALRDAVRGARLRLDGLRLIFKSID